MDQPGKYEQLIGEKLENILLPDMVETIWARIESELDTDLPEGDGNDAGAGPRGGIFGGKGLLIFIGALIMIFFIYQNNKKQNIESSPVLPGIQRTVPANKPPDPPLPAKSTNNRSEPQKEQVKDTGSSLAPVFTQQDQPPPPALDDTIHSNAPSVVVTPPSSVKDSARKKSRGIKGLTDEDYRIIPKKDSSQ